MGAAGGLHHVDLQALLGKVAFMDGYIERQIADQVHRLGDGELFQLLGGGGPHTQGQGKGQRQAETEQTFPVHGQNLPRFDSGMLRYAVPTIFCPEPFPAALRSRT